MEEVSDLAIKLNDELNNGFDYYELVGGDKEKDNIRYTMKLGLASVYWDWHPEAVENLRLIIEETGAKAAKRILGSFQPSIRFWLDCIYQSTSN